MSGRSERILGSVVIENERPKRWLVAMTQPHREALALSHLERQQLTTYCPLVLKRIRHARRSLDVKRPLFPGYIFIGYQPNVRWQAIRSTVGIRTIIKRGDEPDFLDGTFVDALREREADGVIAKPETEFKPGQSVSITHGPLANLIGEVIEMREKERILILFHLMGQEVKTLINAETLNPVR